MPTRHQGVRLADELLDGVRRLLGLPEGTPPAHIIRAGLEKLTGAESPTGEAPNKGGRPRKVPHRDLTSR